MKAFAKVAFLQYAGGGMMTPEELFMKIENALKHAAEIQAHQAEIQARQAESIARNEAAIRDLIAVSRTLVDTAKLHSEQIAALDNEWNEKLKKAEEARERDRQRDREEFNANFNALLKAQLETEQKLQRWIDRQSHN
jgi:hypothetical protein